MIDRTDALAALRRSKLVRDDSGPTRVYRDPAGNVYHSVTTILGATADKTHLQGWAARQDRIYGAGAADRDRNTAATRGSQAHSQAEYLLKTTNKVARATANRRGVLRIDAYGLPHIPSPIFRWAVDRCRHNLPPVSLSAKGYARGLIEWIAANVTQCHACEFSIHHPAGFAGTADALLSVAPSPELPGEIELICGGPLVVDFKTSANKRGPAMLADYTLQLGAYSLGLEHLTGLRPLGALIVVARRVGPPDITFIDRVSLTTAEAGFLDRLNAFKALTPAA
jgi:hypothetical protein